MSTPPARADAAARADRDRPETPAGDEQPASGEVGGRSDAPTQTASPTESLDFGDWCELVGLAIAVAALIATLVFLALTIAIVA